MTVRRIIGLVVLTNLVFAGLVVGLLYVAGLASALPAQQEGNPQVLPPVSFQFPFFQTAEDLSGEPNPDVVAAPFVPGTSYVSFNAVVFKPKTSDGVHTKDAGSHCVFADDSIAGNPATEPIVASLNLPQGAVLSEIRVYWYKGSNTDNVLLELKRTNMLGTVDTPADVASVNGVTGYSSTVTYLSPTITIDNSLYSYHLGAKLNRLGSGVRLCGARVGYVFGNQVFAPYNSKNAP